MPAQTEPFKIFDENKKDEGTIKVYEDKLVEETSVVLRETRESAEIKIKQTSEISIKLDQEKPKLQVNPSNVGVVPPFCSEILEKREDSLFPQAVPMSLDKSLAFLDSGKKQELKAKREACKTLKNSFFDVDEYRADIYNYLRVAEVINHFL